MTSTGRLHATTPAAFLAEVRAGRLDVRKLEVVAIDEVDAIMCEQGSKGSEFNATLPGVAIELLEVLRGGHDSTAMPPPPQFILATAHLSTAHAQAIAGAFPDAKVVRQASSAGGSASKGVLVPTLKQIFVYFSGGDDAKNGKLLEVIDKVSGWGWGRGWGWASASTNAATCPGAIRRCTAQGGPDADLLRDRRGDHAGARVPHGCDLRRRSDGGGDGASPVEAPPGAE